MSSPSPSLPWSIACRCPDARSCNCGAAAAYYNYSLRAPIQGFGSQSLDVGTAASQPGAPSTSQTTFDAPYHRTNLTPPPFSDSYPHATHSQSHPSTNASFSPDSALTPPPHRPPLHDRTPSTLNMQAAPGAPPPQLFQPVYPYGFMNSAYWPPHSSPSSDFAGATLNAPTTTRKRGRPKGSVNQASSSNKRRKTDADSRKADEGGGGAANGSGASTGSATSASSDASTSVPGIGPAGAPRQDPAVNPIPITQTKRFRAAIQRIRNDGRRANGASNAWWFVRGQQANPTLPLSPRSETRPRDNKKYPRLRCVFCGHTWANTSCSQRNCIREHMKKEHYYEWAREIIEKGLKRDPGMREELLSEADRTFDLHRFYELLVDWVVHDDMSLNIVESPYLRRLLAFLGLGNIREHDIPHRTKLADMILERFRQKWDGLLEEIKKATGRISLTADIWSRKDMKGFMAITAHYMIRDKGNDTMRSALVGFRHITGRHDGPKIAATFVDVLKQIGAAHMFSELTMDNASSNDTGMENIAKELRIMGYHVTVEGNRIRCFPHVVNIAVKACLKALGFKLPLPKDFKIDPNAPEDLDLKLLRDLEARGLLPPGVSLELLSDPEYKEALESDLIDAVQEIVHALRSSGQRREALENVIENGNEAKEWLNEKGEFEPINVLTLLRAVDTRWSSYFLMIDRFLVLWQPICKLLASETLLQKELGDLMLSEKQLEALEDVRTFLGAMHLAQELVSGQRTPTLCHVLPIYATLIQSLKEIQEDCPKIKHGVQAAIDKLEEYMDKAKENQAYALAMIINPCIKFSWLKKHAPEKVSEYREALRSAMLKHRKAARATGSASSSSSRPLQAHASAPAQALTAGMSRLKSYTKVRRVRKAASALDAGADASATSRSDSHDRSLLESDEDAQKRWEQEDEREVEAQLQKWESDPPIQDDDPDAVDFDLVRFWQSRQGHFPDLYRVALDIMPMQASAVPCERVFSSSKVTDADRRSKLDPRFMETLQILKFRLHEENLGDAFLHHVRNATEDECARLPEEDARPAESESQPKASTEEQAASEDIEEVDYDPHAVDTSDIEISGI